MKTQCVMTEVSVQNFVTVAVGEALALAKGRRRGGRGVRRELPPPLNVGTRW